MRPFSIDIDPADALLTGFASNVTGATWALAATASGDSLAHQVSIRNDSVTDHSGKTATLVGTDPDGNALTEVMALPGTSATVESVGYFLTLTSVTPSATIGADTMDIGWVDEVSSQTLPVNWIDQSGAAVSVDVTGTVNFTVQETFANILARKTAVWTDITALASKTADTLSTAAPGAVAIRILLNSYSSGAELQMYVVQPNNH